MSGAKKKRRACPECGRQFQKGRTIVRLIGATATRQIVCLKCAANGVLVLASDADVLCELCGKNLARYCHGCVGAWFETATGESLPGMLQYASRAVKKKRAKR